MITNVKVGTYFLICKKKYFSRYYFPPQKKSPVILQRETQKICDFTLKRVKNNQLTPLCGIQECTHFRRDTKLGPKFRKYTVHWDGK